DAVAHMHVPNNPKNHVILFNLGGAVVCAFEVHFAGCEARCGNSAAWPDFKPESGDLAYSRRERRSSPVHGFSHTLADEVYHKFALCFDVSMGVFQRSVESFSGADRDERWLIAEDVEEAVRRGIDGSVGVPGGHPCNGAGDHKCCEELVALVLLQ